MGVYGSKLGSRNASDDYEAVCYHYYIWGFTKLGVPFFGGPIRTIYVYWDLYWGPPISGKCHITPVSLALPT